MRALLMLACAAFIGRMSAGLTFAPMDDADLANNCAIVVHVTITGAPNATFSYGTTRPVTRYSVRIVEVLRANKDLQVAEGQDAVVIATGGFDPSADILVSYPGAPKFVPGGHYVLFADSVEVLDPQPLPIMGLTGGELVLTVHQFALGAFRRAVDLASNVEVAICDGIDHVASPGRTREFTKFVSWIKDSKAPRGRMPQQLQQQHQSARKSGVANYWIPVAPAAIQSAAASYSKREFFTGYPRFCEFDSGEEVRWYSQVGGQPSKPNGYVEYFINAVNAYADLGRQGLVNMKVAYAGTTTSTNGLTVEDNINTIIYDDPNDFIAGSFSNCGGVLGIGGSVSQGSCEFRGIAMRKIIDADVVIQDGVETCAQLEAKDFEELYAHELGHAFGMAHASNEEALMYPSLHGDARGAVFSAYDVDTLQFLYCDTYPDCGSCSAVSDATCSLAANCGKIVTSSCGKARQCEPCRTSSGEGLNVEIAVLWIPIAYLALL